MAMEVTQPKGLPKHALPIVLIILALLSIPIVELARATGSPSVTSALTRDLVTRVIHIQPTSNGLAKVTLAQPSTADQNPTAGASLAGPDQAGRAAQLSLLLTGF